MTKDEALRLALKTLEYAGPSWIEARQPAITAIKAALEAKDEPWEQFYPEMGKPKLAYLPPTESLENACYIPPQRTWVGLTDEEKNSFWKADQMTQKEWDELFSDIEAKLKAKNT